MKRVVPSLVPWNEIMNRVPTHQIESLLSFKAQYDTNLRKVLALPETPPKLHWDYYETHLGCEHKELLNTFRKKYEEMINSAKPPEVNMDAEKAEITKTVEDYIRGSNERIAMYQSMLAEIKEVPPYEQMTWEEYMTIFPEDSPNFKERPTLWPHDPKEQLPDTDVRVHRPILEYLMAAHSKTKS